MKRIKTLTLEEQQTLLDASRYAPDSRFRQRAHVVYLSDKGYRLDQLAEIFAVDWDTASAWLTAWDSVGLMELRDRVHPGRPRRGAETDGWSWKLIWRKHRNTSKCYRFGSMNGRESRFH